MRKSNQSINSVEDALLHMRQHTCCLMVLSLLSLKATSCLDGGTHEFRLIKATAGLPGVCKFCTGPLLLLQSLPTAQTLSASPMFTQSSLAVVLHLLHQLPARCKVLRRI